MLIITTGMPGSGKEEVLKVLSRTGLPLFRMGDEVRKHAKESGAVEDDGGIGKHATLQREINGPAIWAERVLEGLTKMGKGDQIDAVIDGSRSLDEIAHFKQSYKGDVIIIAVHTSPKIRFKRLSGRNRSDAPRNFDEFQSRDNRELSWGIGNVIATADHLLINETSLDEFRSNVRRLVGQLLV